MADMDINPAALASRPSISLTTPVMATKSIAVGSGSQKPKGTTFVIPSRIDLEPIYANLKAHIEPEKWPIYKEATTQFLIGMVLESPYLDWLL